MKAQTKAKQTRLRELAVLTQRVEELNKAEAAWKRENEELQKSESRFRSYFDLPLYGIAITSPEQGWLEVNDRLCSIMGYARDEIVRMTWSEMTHPADLEEDLKQFQRILSGQIEQYHMEKRFIRKDGEVIWTRLSVGCVRKPDGSVDHTVAMVEDITSVKSAEDSLRESEEKYRLVVENADEAILIAQDNMLRFVNPMTLSILGYSEEELLSRPFIECIHLEDRKKLLEAHKKIMQGEAPEPVRQFRFICRDGTVKWADSKAVTIMWKGKPATLNFITDITERKKAEEERRESEARLRAITDSAQDAILMMDPKGLISYWNPSAERILGYTSAEAIGQNLHELLVPSHYHKAHREAFSRFQREGRGAAVGQTLDLEALRKGGMEISVQLSLSTVHMKDGWHAVGVLRDITERKRMEAEITALSITDQLTGLHNRRGFLSLAEQQLKLAERNKGGMLLFFADVDGLKWINDTLGHEEGDKALIESARILKETFRDSDIVARLGGDEYAALTMDTTETNADSIMARLQSMIDRRNNQENRRYRLSISIGCSYYDPENPCSMDELMSRADKLMYQNKQNREISQRQRESHPQQSEPAEPKHDGSA